MRLYVMRHGAAVEHRDWDGEDDKRPLVDKGRRQTHDVVEKLLKTDKLHVDQIWSSPLPRALETAEIAAKLVKLKVQVVPALTCGASLESLQPVVEAQQPMPKRLMLVGHEPDCGEIIAALIGDADGNHALKKSGVALLDGKFAPKGMRLLWKVAPV